MRWCNYRTVAAALGLLCLSGCNQQQLDDLNMSIGDLSKKVGQLQATLDEVATQEDLRSASDELDKKIEAVDSRGVKQEELILALKENYEEFQRQISDKDEGLLALVAKNQELIAEVKRLNDRQETLLAAVTKTGDLGDGFEFPDVNAIMRDPVGRQDMDTAVHQSLHANGEVVIWNWTNQDHTVFVNQTRQFISSRLANGPGILIVNVPVGTVTTELGSEFRTWTLAPPGYQLNLQITP